MYWILCAFSRLISLLPEAVVEGLARLLAFFVFDIVRLRRRLVLHNLEIALGDVYDPLEREEIARESYRNFLLTCFEVFRSFRHDISANIDANGEEHLKQALEGGQGAYILCFHLGNWEAMGAYINKRIAPAHVLVKKVGGGSMNQFVEDVREHNGFRWVKRKSKGDGLRGILKVLAAGEVVGFVMDQSRPGEPKLPFFGTPAKTNTSFAAIWRKKPAPIVPAFIHRKKLGHHVLEFMPALDMVTTDSKEQDILDHSVLFNHEVEKAVRRYPEHYFWLHNRWKS